MPIDEHDGRVRRQRLDPGVAAPYPLAVLLGQPIDRALGTRLLAPCPAFLAPEFAHAIAAGLDEDRKLGVRHRRLGDAKRF